MSEKHPGRPSGVMALAGAAKRLRGFEMYMSGIRKSDIAKNLGVTPAAVGNWSKADNWDLRLQSLKSRVKDQAELISQTSLAAILADMQIRLRQRVAELESLCGPAVHPTTRLAAIRTWFQVTKELEQLAPPKATDIPASAFIDDLTAHSGQAAPVGGPDNAGEVPPSPRVIQSDDEDPIRLPDPGSVVFPVSASSTRG